MHLSPVADLKILQLLCLASHGLDVTSDPLSSHGITSNSNSYGFCDCLDGLWRQGVCIAHLMCMGFQTVLGDVPWLVTVVTGPRWVLGLRWNGFDLSVFLSRVFLGHFVVDLSGHCGDWIYLAQPLFSPSPRFLGHDQFRISGMVGLISLSTLSHQPLLTFACMHMLNFNNHLFFIDCYQLCTHPMPFGLTNHPLALVPCAPSPLH